METAICKTRGEAWSKLFPQEPQKKPALPYFDLRLPASRTDNAPLLCKPPSSWWFVIVDLADQHKLKTSILPLSSIHSWTCFGTYCAIPRKLYYINNKSFFILSGCVYVCVYCHQSQPLNQILCVYGGRGWVGGSIPALKWPQWESS